MRPDPLDPPPLRPMAVHRSLLPPQVRRGSVFVLGGEELLVADDPRMEGEFWRFQARRNARPNA